MCKFTHRAGAGHQVWSRIVLIPDRAPGTRQHEKHGGTRSRSFEVAIMKEFLPTEHLAGVELSKHCGDG
jgi:hypothetical protein